jgi:phage terminase large subunit GpA-like protein
MHTSANFSQLSANPIPHYSKTSDLIRQWGRGLAPPPLLSIPDWADKFRFIARNEGGGKWSTATVEIARGPMLAATEPGVHIITAMAATQILKTSLLQNIWAYFAHLDPCPILLVQPKDEAAESFSKERITPTIQETPVLRAIVGTAKTRSAEETIRLKQFPGGFLAVVGAGSPTNLASRPVRVILCDEIDKYEATREGDPIVLGEERTARFGLNWLSVRCCSPTVEGESRIETSYLESDQRRASVACPHCSHRQFLDFFRHVHWSKNEAGEHMPETAAVYCEACGAAWSEGERLRSLRTIRWHQTRPYSCCGVTRKPLDDYERAWRNGARDPIAEVWELWQGPRWHVYRARCPRCGEWPVSNHHAGFQAGKEFSPWAKDKPSDVARKWLIAHKSNDEDQIGPFYNTQLGRPYKRKIGKQVEPDALMARREVYPADCPDGVALVTVGADSQGDRIELEFVGWGRDEESWSLAYEVVEGDQEKPEFWARVRELLVRRFLRADGVPFTAAAACFDSGGHHTQAVYRFCRENALLLPGGVHAIKGASERTGQRSPIWPPVAAARRSKGSGYRPTLIGTNAAKDSIASRLLIEEPGPGFMHFPHWFDKARFDQLTSEQLVPKTVGGWTIRVWQPKASRSNEALDCRVYAYAALCGVIAQRRWNLNKIADQVGAKSAPVVFVEAAEAAGLINKKAETEVVPIRPPWITEKVAKPQPRQSGWLGSRGGFGQRKGWLR